MKPFQHILVPTDFGEPAQHALETAIMIARKFDASITLFHAYYLPPLAYGEGWAPPLGEIAAAAQQAMDQQLAAAQRDYPKIKAIVRGASPAGGVLSVARELSADLIAMGTHGRRGVSHFVLGSVAENVVRLATVPVLTISAKAQA
jgi:nucleotide-binding universal stress UspA family protein